MGAEQEVFAVHQACGARVRSNGTNSSFFSNLLCCPHLAWHSVHFFMRCAKNLVGEQTANVLLIGCMRNYHSALLMVSVTRLVARLFAIVLLCPIASPVPCTCLSYRYCAAVCTTISLSSHRIADDSSQPCLPFHALLACEMTGKIVVANNYSLKDILGS